MPNIGTERMSLVALRRIATGTLATVLLALGVQGLAASTAQAFPSPTYMTVYETNSAGRVVPVPNRTISYEGAVRPPGATVWGVVPLKRVTDQNGRALATLTAGKPYILRIAGTRKCGNGYIYTNQSHAFTLTPGWSVGYYSVNIGTRRSC